MKVNVFGHNINALVCAGCLSETGNKVTLVGNRKQQGAEPGLVKLLDEQEDSGRLSVSKDYDIEADFHIIALESNECQQAKKIAQRLATEQQRGHRYIVVRTSFSIGTVNEIERLSGLPCIVNPDFAADGQAIQAFKRPDRIIIGTHSTEAATQFKRLFAPFNRNRDVTIEMSPQSAELTKYATNAMLATRISLMNELAIAAEKIGADIEQVRQGIGADQRIGASYLYAGIGFGGNHFEVDLTRLQTLINPQGLNQGLLHSVSQINNHQKEILFRKLWQYFECDLQGKTIAFWGVSYKPNSNSIEGAPSLALIKAFLHQGCQIQIYDPMLDFNFKIWVKENISLAHQNNIRIETEMYQATQAADALCVVTEWQPFWSPDLAQLKTNMTHPIILDGRNLYDRQWIEDHAFTYFGIGR